MDPVKWGILSTANIGLQFVVPAMQRGEHCDIVAIASREGAKAESAARTLGIPRSFGSYDALLADPDVEAVYNPLPNHLHVEWSIRALEAGKHVLCEKPIGMNAAEVEALIAARDRTGLVVEEAFMVRDHPQWSRIRDVTASGRIGELRAVQIAYTYNNTNPRDIRNQLETGGGGTYDLGCYACTIARLIFGHEPQRALALMDRDPTFGVDRLSSAILEFPAGHANIYVSTQTARYQQVQILGSEGWIRAEVPFAHPPTLAARLSIGADERPGTEAAETIRFEPVDQYTLQGDRFSRLVRGEDAVAWPLEVGMANMRVLDALFRSAESGAWERVSPE